MQRTPNHVNAEITRHVADESRVIHDVTVGVEAGEGTGGDDFPFVSSARIPTSRRVTHRIDLNRTRFSGGRGAADRAAAAAHRNHVPIRARRAAHGTDIPDVSGTFLRTR